ncbi:polyprenyl synthetase family protein [Streptomyces uncialis]|uniref:polyprenyl synthetase family protein n=1 Tax=Streptomyces uncialis TaxID=1048205 RepID=UPI003801E2D1
MRRTAAQDHPAAAPRPPSGPASLREPPPGHRRVPSPESEARLIDADVPAAVGRTLAAVLGERRREAAHLDPLFARDLAERVARFTLDGGKRLRSQFLWWALRTCGAHPGTVAPALRFAAGLELIQTCALVHDDVMDGSPLRRGRPALHTALREQYGTGTGTRRPGGTDFGSSAAVLAGDLALAWADDTVADTDLPDAVRARVRAEWRALRTEMVAGQYLDLHGQVTGARSRAQALRVARLKSALYTVERPLALGAALAGADERTARSLGAAGRCAGIAFQLRDDLLGVFGDPQATGKPSGEDIREGKLTYLTAVGRARAESSGDRAAVAVLDTALGDPRLSAGDLDRVRATLVMTGAREVVEARIDHLVTLAGRHLAAVTGGSPRAAERLGHLLATIARGEPPPHRPPAPDPLPPPVSAAPAPDEPAPAPRGGPRPPAFTPPGTGHPRTAPHEGASR